MARFPLQMSAFRFGNGRCSTAHPAGPLNGKQQASEELSRTSWRLLSFLVLAVVLVSLVRPYKYHRDHPVIYSDGIGYHLWTRAILEGDLSFRHYAHHEELLRGPPGQQTTQLRLTDPTRRIYQNKYPPGVALLRLPVMAFLVKRHQDHPLITPAEHWASTVLAALALLGVCLLCLQTCRMLEIPSAASHMGVVTVVLGTGLFHYGTADGSFSHIYSALLGSLLLWLGTRAVVGKRAALPPLATAFACCLLVLIRNTNVLLLGGLVVAYLVARQASGTWNRRRIGQDGLTVLAGAGAGIALQLGYNCYANGAWTLSSYQGEPFLWHRPMQLAVLFSYERGVFTYYPILAVVLGVGLALRRTRLWTAWFALVLLAYATLYGFWGCWMLGGSFGYRGVVEVLPPAIVLFAAEMNSLSARARRVMTVCAWLCVLVTVELMIGNWRWRFADTTRARHLYWEHVAGKNSILWFLRGRS